MKADEVMETIQTKAKKIMVRMAVIQLKMQAKEKQRILTVKNLTCVKHSEMANVEI